MVRQGNEVYFPAPFSIGNEVYCALDVKSGAVVPSAGVGAAKLKLTRLADRLLDPQ